jgi:hypothetical protein
MTLLEWADKHWFVTLLLAMLAVSLPVRIVLAIRGKDSQ